MLFFIVGQGYYILCCSSGYSSGCNSCGSSSTSYPMYYYFPSNWNYNTGYNYNNAIPVIGSSSSSVPVISSGSGNTVAADGLSATWNGRTLTNHCKSVVKYNKHCD